MEIYPDFQDLLRLFNARSVEYVIVGGYAVGHHGAPRYTGDIDLFVKPSSLNARRVMQALDEFGFGSVGLAQADFERPGRVVQLGYPPCRIDIVTSIEGVDFDDASADASDGTYGKVPVRYLGLRSLLRNKRATGRPKDAADVEALEQSAPDR